MSLSVANTNLFLDHFARIYERVRGYNTSVYGLGDTGDTERAMGVSADLLTAIAATADAAVINGLYAPITRLQTSLQTERRVAELLRNPLQQIEGLIRALGISGVTTLATYLAYYNTGAGGTWTALQNPAWRDLYHGWRGSYPSAIHCYFEILEAGTWRGTTYTNALGKFVVSGAGAGVFTNGAAVDSTKYAGGVGNLKISGLAGSGDVTITGVGFDPATGAVTTSKTWITAITVDGNVTMVPGAGTAPANCLIVDVTNMSVSAGITAGTIFLEGKKPTGRLAVPA